MDILNLKSVFNRQAEKLAKHLNDEIRQLFQNGFAEYQLNEYQSANNVKTFIERYQSVPLSEIYFPTRLSKKRNWPVNILSKHKPIVPSSIKDFQTTSNIMIIGNAGSGKSMLTKHLFVESILEDHFIPINIELRNLGREQSIREYISHTILSNKIAVSEKLADRMIKSEDILLILDGFDEVEKDRRRLLVVEINNLTKNYFNIKFVITSRPELGIESLPTFDVFEMCELTEPEIERFIRLQLRKEKEKTIVEILHSIELGKNSYSNYLMNPLLLSMFIFTFRSFSNIPDRKSEFYNQVFDTLYSRHDSVNKGIFIRKKESKLSKDQFKKILNTFSYYAYTDGRFSFRQALLENYLDKCKKSEDIDFVTEDLIEDLTVSINILTKEGLTFVFPHRSLQEFFAAMFITKLSTKVKLPYYQRLFEKFSIQPSMLDKLFFELIYELDQKDFEEFIVLPLLKKAADSFDSLSHGYHRQLGLVILISLERIGVKFHNDLPCLVDSKETVFKELQTNKFAKIEHERLKEIINRRKREELDILNLKKFPI